MSIQLFSNNAKTTLAAGITSTQTNITVAPGTGSLFPSPSAGQQFKVTLVSASSASVYEICNCTSRSGDVLTVVRGQEGTSAQPFLLDDTVGHFDTAGVMGALVQTEQLQTQYYQYAQATGTANAITATVPSTLTALQDGMYFTIMSAAANTGAVTLNLTLGTTSTGVTPVVKGNNSPLISGDIPSAGYPLSLIYSATYGAWVLSDANVVLTPYALINSQTFTGTPRVPTPTTSDNSTLIASTAYVQNNLVNYAPIFSPTLTGTPAAPTASAGTSTTQLATTAFVQNAVSGIPVIGQTWTDVTGSRSQGVTYYNTTGKTIQVQGNFGCNGGGQGYIYINGTLISHWAAQFNGCGGYSVNMPVLVPPGASYQLANMGGGNQGWYELI